MNPSDAAPSKPLVLTGGPYARGLAQAALCPEMVEEVRHAIHHRLAETAAALARKDVRRFVAAQRAYTQRQYPEILAEVQGIAAGFRVSEGTLFDYLHCSSVMDLAALSEPEPDGCTSFAVPLPGGGAFLAKNRDYRPEHVPIQRVMRHSDPEWGRREILVLGSLGSPGNFSSGINSDGFAVSDTASRTSDMGVGLHRYFLLTWLLVHCATVNQALAAIRRITHTGSGLLILADASGAVAAIELGHRRTGIEFPAAGPVGRTNHFVTAEMAPSNLETEDSAPRCANSNRRWDALRPMLARLPASPTVDQMAGLLARHNAADGAAFCRHGATDLSTTISGAIYSTRERRMYAALGNPCVAGWQRFDLTVAATMAAVS